MSFSSNDVNLLIYRYMQESGFTHSAFAFKNESQISDETLASEKTRRGVLINFIQKGLVYTEIESHIKPDGGEVNCRQPFSITQEHVCKEEKAPLVSAATASDGVYEVLQNKVSQLTYHKGEVFACQWNPKFPQILATGSSDASAVLWSVDSPSGPQSGTAASETRSVLKHNIFTKQKDVTTLEWSPDGQQLVTGAYDGCARIWSLSGKLEKELRGHNGPIFSLRWTTDGKYLLSGGVDRTARIWDVRAEKQVKRYNVHTAPTLDVSWRDNISFATCSTDKTIAVCRWDKPDPLVRYSEHADEVNAVVWDPNNNLLASCSDDRTIKVWDTNEKSSRGTMRGHDREIYTVRWRPAGKGSANPNLASRLLSASFDGTARLWDIETEKCVKKFPRHKQPVYAIQFSPDGQYCVVGSFDKSVEVFHVDSGECIQSYTGPGGIFDVDWSSSEQHGDRVAVSTATGSVLVIDVRKGGVVKK